MNEVHIDDINENYNFMILSNQSYRLLSEKYELTTNMLEEADFISGMGYNLLETIDQELKNIIYKINKLKQNLDSKIRQPSLRKTKRKYRFLQGKI